MAMDPSSPSAEQLEFYQRHGFVVAPGFFSAEELEPLQARFVAIVNEDVPAPEGMLVMRDVMVAKGAVEPGSRQEAIAKIQDYQNDEVLFGGYVRHARLLDWIAAFVGPDIKSIHTMLINKPPNVDGRHPLHQDLLYFPFRPADQIIATWTALEPITRENGCLVVVPGSQKRGLLKHGNPDWEYLNLAYFGAEGVGEHTERQHLEMEPGDTVFFHPLLLHGSGRNRTSGFRRAISAHYASAQCRFVEADRIGGTRPYLLVRGREYQGAI